MSVKISLDAIGLAHGTDKSSFHHNYLNFYETHFARLRERAITVLEIGILNGASLKVWKDYFPRAKIVGADIMPATKKFEEDRVSVEILDQSNIEELTSLATRHGPFDIIIEDGSHMWEHQITTLRTLFLFVKKDGIYIVEDLQTNYGSLRDDYRGISGRTCVDYLKSWLDLCVADDELPLEQVEDAFLRTYGRSVRFLAFYRRACLIQKAYRAPIRERNPGSPLRRIAKPLSACKVHVLAHISGIGDVVGNGGYVHLGDDPASFQGLSIDSPAAPVEYRVRSFDGLWSEWTANNGFVGTRGQARLLSGVAVRLAGGAKEGCVLRVSGRFAGSAAIVEAGDGEDCTAASGGALCGLQVDIEGR